VLGSRTDGALEEERSWPNGTWTARASLADAVVSLVRGAARFDCSDVAGALCFGLGFMVSGCSAVAALAETHRAERALVSTEGLSPTPAASYAITLSRAYLDKAREEASEAHYGSAVAFAKSATAAAQDAQRTQLSRLVPAAQPLTRTLDQAEVPR
jgi:hypothetical protein